MRINAGIITPNLEATKEFYTTILRCRVDFENDFYLLIGTESGTQISFLLPDHPSQKPLFQSAFTGKGVYITVEVADVDLEYNRINALDIPIEIELRQEPWGDKHFAVIDPNGIGIDIVTHTPPEPQE